MQDKTFFNLYKILTSRKVLLLRLLTFAVLTIILLLFIDEYQVLVRILPVYFVLFLQELFIHLKLNKIEPAKKVEDSKNLNESLTFEARADLESDHTSFEIASAIVKTNKGKYLMQKIGTNITLLDVIIEKNDILNQAADLVRALHGKYIYPIDILAAYILLQEPRARIFEKMSLVKQDMVGILYWTRRKFHIDEVKLPLLRFKGSGVFDSLVFGWTPETQHYTADFTHEVLGLGYVPRAVGRAIEYKQFVESLLKSSSSNILLVGDPGVGKSTLITNFAYDAYQGLINKYLKRKRMFFLFVDRLLSGVSTKGDLENRLTTIFTEVSHSGNIMLFIEDMENILGGGGFDFDMAGALTPYLTSNRVQIIGTITPQAYRQYVENKPSIQSLFNVLQIKEPGTDAAIFMIIEDATIREELSKAVITYPALKEVIENSKLYSPEIALPGCAARLLEDSVIRAFGEGRYAVTAEDVKALVSEKTGVKLSSPIGEEKEILLNLEEEIHRELIGQDEAVSAVSNALRRARSGIKKDKGPIASFLFLGPTGVGKTTTAKLLTRMYFEDESKLIRVDMSEYQTQESIKKILGGLPGEENFEETFLDKVEKNPFSVVLLDEFEKAHPKLLDVFLQILDEGFVTDNKGNRVSFANSIIISTSNAGSEFIREKIVTGNEKIKDELIEHILTKGIFRPELINRFDDIVVFHPLSKEQVVEIVRLEANELSKKMLEQYITLIFKDEALESISKSSYDPDFGARNVERYIKDNIENPLSRLILEEKVGKGDKVEVGIDDLGNVTINKA